MTDPKVPAIAGALVALAALEQAGRERPSMHGHVLAECASHARAQLIGEPCACDACTMAAGADLDTDGGVVADGGAGGSVPGTPPAAHDFSPKTEALSGGMVLPSPPLGEAETRLLESLVEPDVAGKRVPSPWDRVPGGGGS